MPPEELVSPSLNLRELEGLTSKGEDFALNAPIEELEDDVARIKGVYAKFIVEVLEQENAEGEIERLIREMEKRTREIRDESRELEETELAREGHKIFSEAEKLDRELDVLKKRAFDLRRQGLKGVKKQTHALDARVKQLDARFGELMQRLNEKEKEARKEDELAPEVRRQLIQKRLADHFMAHAVSEFDYPRRRLAYFERAAGALADIPDTVYGVKEMKSHLALCLQDARAVASLALTEKAIAGGESEKSLSYTMHAHIRLNRPAEFYACLRQMHVLLANDPNADRKLLTKIEDLLTLVSGRETPPSPEEKRYLDEAHKFLRLAGNGVVRAFVTEKLKHLSSRSDYVRLGRQLVHADMATPDGVLWMSLKVAVTLPRMYDLGLCASRFARIFEKRLKQRPVHHVTPHIEVGTTDTMEDAADIPGSAFIPGWKVQLAEGDLPVIRQVERKTEVVEIGKEQRMEGQIYVMDVSGSMMTREKWTKFVEENGFPTNVTEVDEFMGPTGRTRGFDGWGSFRWFLRDAFFLSALNSFSVDAAARRKKRFPNFLYLALFDHQVGKVVMVRSQEEAKKYLRLILGMEGNPKSEGDAAERSETFIDRLLSGGGGTAIGNAAGAAYDKIGDARGQYRGLKEAKVIIITDGQNGEQNFDLVGLLRKQMLGDTRIQTRGVSIEDQCDDLETLVRASAPGTATYKRVPNAYDEIRTLANPPANQVLEASHAEEKFPEYLPQQQFHNDIERARFWRTVQEKTAEIAAMCGARRKGEKILGEKRTKELGELMYPKEKHFDTFYELRSDGSPDRTRTRKSMRAVDIFSVLTKCTDDDMSSAETMTLLRELGSQRSVLYRDLAQICKRSGAEETLQAIAAFRDTVYPALKAREEKRSQVKSAL